MKTLDYTKMGEDFLKETGTTLDVVFLKYAKHFDDDKEPRDVYTITLRRGNREFSFPFGQSINASGQWVSTYHDGYDRPKGSKAHGKKPFSLMNYGLWIANKHFRIPTAYDILACLTKYDPGTFEDFCVNFGYDTDSRKAEKVYQAVCKEWDMVRMLWTDEEISKLEEIQ